MKRILIFVFVVVIAAGGYFTYKYFTIPEVEDVALDVVLKDAEELTTQKIVISDAFECQKGKIPFINKNRFLVKYTTTVEAGFDVSEVEIDETDSKVIVSIPHCSIDESSIKIKSNDIVMYDTNLSVFNVNTDAVLEVISEAEKRAKKTATSEEYGFLAAADENAIKVIRGLFENVVKDRELVVEFK